MNEALDRAIRIFYADIPSGARVLDVGCGWGGTSAMLGAERACDVLGWTISRTQHRFCRSNGLNVHLANAQDDSLPIPSGTDVAVLIELLSYIEDKEGLLRRLRRRCGRLVSRTHCRRGGPRSAAAGRASTLVGRSALERMFERTGWSIRRSGDRRSASMPTVGGRLSRLERLPRRALTGRFPHLRRLCRIVLEDPERWSADHPLVEIVAD